VPRWGLTAQQCHLAPWGLDPRLLGPCKVITDPVQGDIHTNVLEQAIIDTEQFQRLRRVRQLGNTSTVYPGATHTRFSHSLGVLRVAQDLLDTVTVQEQGLHNVPDRIGQWRRESQTNLETPGDCMAQRHIAAATVAARIGALCHDIGHVPFGHTIEDDLTFLISHDKNIERFDSYWESIGAAVKAHVLRKYDRVAERSLGTLFATDGELRAEVAPLIVSKAESVPAIGNRRYPFVADLVGNTICADLLDYLLRDHLFTGLPASLGMRFTSAFFVVPTGRGPYSERLAISIFRDGRERADVVSELLKALRYRYELQERVLTHHAKLVADAMVGKMLELVSDGVWLEEAVQIIEKLPGGDTLVGDPNIEPLRTAVTNLETADGPTGSGAVLERVRGRLERLLYDHGDDGLLESIAESDSRPMPATVIGPRLCATRKQAASLARQLMRRELFKFAGHVGPGDAAAPKLFEQYGDRVQRVALQDEAQRFAELGAEPRVLIWLPGPNMHLKLADVLVDDGDHIDTFANYERARGGRGSEIYDAHLRLWSLWVWLHPGVEDREAEVVLAFLAGKLGVRWDSLSNKLGGEPGEYVDRLALSRVLEIPGSKTSLDKDLPKDLLPLIASSAARASRSFNDRVTQIEALPEVVEAVQAQQKPLAN
jgi:HD superfamily phosphohydrolase